MLDLIGPTIIQGLIRLVRSEDKFEIVTLACCFLKEQDIGLRSMAALAQTPQGAELR